MKSEKITSCVVIKSTLEQLQEKLLEQGRALEELLKAAYPDTKAVLAAIGKIEFLMQDQPEDISDQWVTACVKTDDSKKFILNLSVREVRIYYCSLHLPCLIFGCLINFVVLLRQCCRQSSTAPTSLSVVMMRIRTCG